MTVSISDARIAPITEDLTVPEGRLEVLRGFEQMYRVDVPYGDAQAFVLGEWACIHADGKAYRATSTPVAASYLVFCGNDRYDAKATGQVTLIQSDVIASTTLFDAVPTYVPGDYLTVKAYATGKSGLTKWASGQFAVAIVKSVAGGKMTFQTMAVPVKMT
jgi:hypothetical protein